MHDLDRTKDIMEAGLDALDDSELGLEYEEDGDEFGFELDDDESEIEDLAAELLTVGSDEELEQFLGKLIKRAGRAIGKFARSGVGRALGGVLKSAAKSALPIVGGALGNLVAPGVGGAIGSRLASGAGRLFGLELDDSQLEFEIAKKYVQFATDAAKAASKAPDSVPPKAIVKAAVVSAAKKQGLLPKREGEWGGGLYRGYARPRANSRRAGQWVRRGNRIVLIGV